MFMPEDLRRVRRPWLAALLAVCCLGGCRGESPEGQEDELEAVDVAPSLEIETADDPTATERAPSLVGLLPPGFPGDLPLYLPASLVDWGSGEGGRYVNLLTPHGRSRVERELTRLVREGGWTVTASGGGWLLRKGGQRVRLRIENGNPGTLYRFEY